MTLSEKEGCKTLRNLLDVRIDPLSTREKRVQSYIEQIVDPYHFKVGDVEVSIAFDQADGSINDRFAEMLSLMQ